MNALLQNLRYATHQLLRNPGFSAVTVLTVALGIGATTVIFSLVNAVLLRPLPVHEPDRLVGVEEVLASGEQRYAVSYPSFLEYREGGDEVARLGAYGIGDLSFSTGGQARALLGSYVTGDYFDLLGISPARGRFFTPEEEIAGSPEPVAVISHGLWQRHFGGDPRVIGRTVRLNSQPLTVVGVAPEGFRGLVTGLATEVWVPIPMYALLEPGSDIDTPGRMAWLVMFGRLSASVEAPATEAVLGAVARGIEEWGQGGMEAVDVRVGTLSGIPGPGRTPVRLFLALLMATAGLVLLIACVNVAGMLLARATTRRREIGIRLALGAGRGRLVGQLLTESTLLFLLGGVGGILLAVWLTGLVTTLPDALPVELSLDAAPDARVVGFALLLSLATGLLFGLAPALRASRPNLVPVLKEGGGASGGRSRLRSALVVGQIAVCLLLLVTAGLLVRSLQSALAVDPGINAEGVTVASLDLTPHGYDETRGRVFYEELMQRLGAQPGVESVALAGLVPLSFNQFVYSVRIPGHEPSGERETFSIDYNAVSPDYFRTLEIPVQEGRGFTDADGADAPGVVMVNRTMATRFWPDGSAIGQRIQVGGEDVEIVGIAADGKYQSLDEEPMPFMYLSFAQEYGGQMTLHVRAAGGLGAVAGTMRRELQQMDANVPLVAPASLEQRIRMSLLPQRVGAALIGVFGGLGLLLAAVGLYGILAYTVSQRTREIGVRLALGAGAGSVLRMVLRQGVVMAGIGVAIGLLAALAVTRLLSGLLFGVSPADPLTFAAVAVILICVALLASYLPARRAARVDPMIALKAD